MKLVETGSPPLTANKKDWVFLLKLCVIAALTAVTMTIKDNIQVINDLIPDSLDNLVSGGLMLFITFLVQFLGDTRKKIEDDANEEKPDPLPPMTIWLLFALFVVVPAIAIAQVGSFRAESTEKTSEFKPYTLIRLECEEEGTSFVWILRRLPDGLRPDSIRVNNGKEIVWTGPPGVYDVDTIYTDSKGILQQVFTRIAIVNPDNQPPAPPVPPGPGPSPPSPPGPTPPTPPSPPNVVTPLPKPTGDRFGFGGISYDLAMAIDVPNRNKLAEKVADNYGSVSAAIFAGGIVDVRKAMEEIRTRNRDLSSDPAFQAWAPWFDKLGFEVQQNWNNKKFTTRSDIAEVFREVQTGLLATQGKKPE